MISCLITILFSAMKNKVHSCMHKGGNMGPVDQTWCEMLA